MHKKFQWNEEKYEMRMYQHGALALKQTTPIYAGSYHCQSSHKEEDQVRASRL